MNTIMITFLCFLIESFLKLVDIVLLTYSVLIISNTQFSVEQNLWQDQQIFSMFYHFH